MTALATNRDTKARGLNVIPQRFSMPVAASTNCFQGGIAVIALGTGNAKPATAATGLLALGIFTEPANNSTGSAGAINALIEAGVFRLGNSTAGDAIAAANIGQVCYLVDDQTVALTSAGQTRSPAGIIVDVDATSTMVDVSMGIQHAGLAGAGGATSKAIQTAGATLAAGTATVNTGISLTATSVIVPVIKTVGAGVQGTHYSIVVNATGAPGTASFTCNAVSTAGGAVLVNTDVNVMSFLIYG